MLRGGLRRRWPLLTIGVVLIVAAAHLALVACYASDQPFSDQWGAEGHIVFEQWLHGRMQSWNLIATHAEHRPILMRLLTFGLFVTNGQWDCRVEMVAGAAIMALAAGLLYEFARRGFSPRRQAFLAVLAAGLFSLPSNYENTLWGFQSQFYFLILLGPLHVLGTLRCSRLGVGWGLAQFAGLLALWSIAAGVASAVALLVLAAVRLGRNSADRWARATLTVNLALLAFAWWLQPEAAALNSLHATSVAGFLESTARLLAWPVPAVAGVLLAVPSAVVVVRWLRFGPARDSDVVIVGLTVWLCLTVAVIAYGRGAHPGEIAVRYFDVLAIGLFAQGCALLRLGEEEGVFGQCWRWAGALWLIAIVVGLGRINTPAELGGVFAARKDFYSRQTAAIRNYLASDDEAWLERDQLVRHFFPHYQFTKDVLRDPLLRRRLSPSLLLPLEVDRDPARSRGFASATGFEIAADADAAADQLFVSKPLDRVGLAFLRFRVQGPTRPGAGELWLEDGEGRVLRSISATPRGDNGWHTMNFRAPAGPVRVVARVPAGQPVFVFERPIEVGWLSWIAPKIAGAWVWFAVAGMMAWAAAARRDGIRRGRVA